MVTAAAAAPSSSQDDDNDNGACRPLPGQTYLAIGQDLFSIEEYLREQYNASLHDYIRKRDEPK